MSLGSVPLLLAGHHLRHRGEHWTEGRLSRHQRARLDRLVAHLRRHSPYYRDLDLRPGASLTDLPVIDKAQMMEHFDRINTAGLHRDDLVSFRMEQEREGGTGLYRGRYSVGLSSGTSGNKLLTVLSRRERAGYGALLWARSGIPRLVRDPRVLFALRTNNPAYTAVSALGVRLHFVDYFVPLAEVVRLVNDSRLNVLAGPPSLLGELAQIRDRITSPIEAVVSYAEELDDASRRRIAAAFDAPVLEIYQGAEGMLGYTCARGSLHLNADVTLVELMDAADTIGGARRAVITDLYRRTQPFVRYQLNDLIELAEACPCGSAFPRIARVHGRADSILRLAGTAGGLVSLMPDYVRRSVNEASDDVLEYQVIQRETDDVEVDRKSVV